MSTTLDLGLLLVPFRSFPDVTRLICQKIRSDRDAFFAEVHFFYLSGKVPMNLLLPRQRNEGLL